MTAPNTSDNSSGEARNAASGQNFWTAPNLLALTLVGTVFVVLAALTWRKWPDAIIDFGTQLYIPWRLTNGAVLYRDLFYIGGGPVSQYFNALLFKIFGASFSTLIAANLIFSAALLVYVYRRFLKASDALTATMICLGIVVAFTFAEYTQTGNYNYISPYAHEALHGVLLSLLTVGLLADWFTQQKLRFALLAGFCAGLVFLTKPDIFLALFICSATTLVLHWLKHRNAPFALKSLACFGLTFLMPPLFFFLFFLRVEDWHASLRSVVFGWVAVFQPAVRTSPYYRKLLGLDNPLAHLQQMATQFLCAAFVIGIYSFFFRKLNRWSSGPVKSPWIIWLVLLSPLLIWAFGFKWPLCGPSLPLWVLTILILLAWQLKAMPNTDALVFPFVWSVFALFLMSKLGLDARIWHYGFALAMPAFVITVYFLLWLLPKLLETRYAVPSRYMRGAVLLVLLTAYIMLYAASDQNYRLKRQPLGPDGDTIITYGPGAIDSEAFKIALAWMDKNMPPDATLAVLPSGITLNYLSRHVNSTPILFWDPIVLSVFDQSTMTARFEAAPPDYVLLVEQDHSEFGVRYFGSTPGYGLDLMQWIKKNYKAVLIVGNEPLRDGRFGLEFFKRIPSGASDTKTASEQ